MESGRNGKGQVRVEQFQFYKKSYFVCCLVRGFAEEEKIVIEARRQRRRLEEERQQMANNQVRAHQQLFASFELFLIYLLLLRIQHQLLPQHLQQLQQLLLQLFRLLLQQ